MGGNMGPCQIAATTFACAAASASPELAPRFHAKNMRFEFPASPPLAYSANIAVRSAERSFKTDILPNA